MKNCPIAYVEIPSPKFEETKTFYREVFGWKISDSDLDNSNYAMFSCEKSEYGLTGGGFDPNLKPLQSGSFSFYIGVTDIPQFLEKIKSNGGAIIKEKSEIGGGYGFYSIFTDPNDNHIGLYAKE